MSAESYIMIIPLDPHSKGRPRASITKDYARSRQKCGCVPLLRTPKDTEEWTTNAVAILKQQWKKRPIETPVIVILRMVAPPLKSATKKSKKERQWRVGSHDVDNEEKAVLDAMQKAGVLKNDNLAVQTVPSKVYGAEWERCPKIEIIVCDAADRPRPTAIPMPGEEPPKDDGKDPEEGLAKGKRTVTPLWGGTYKAPKGPDPVANRPYKRKGE